MNDKKELVFLYHDERCHAIIVRKLFGDETFIGRLDGYKIYEIDPHALFDQWGFVAIKEEEDRK